MRSNQPGVEDRLLIFNLCDSLLFDPEAFLTHDRHIKYLPNTNLKLDGINFLVDFSCGP